MADMFQCMNKLDIKMQSKEENTLSRNIYKDFVLDLTQEQLDH